MEQFRALSSEAEKLVTDARLSEGQVSNYKNELRQKMEEDVELKEKLRSLQVELEQVCAINHLFFIKVQFFIKVYELDSSFLIKHFAK